MCQDVACTHALQLGGSPFHPPLLPFAAQTLSSPTWSPFAILASLACAEFFEF